MRLSAPARRGLRGVAAGAVVAAGIVLLPATAQAAEAGIDRVGYECIPSNPLIKSALEKHYQFYVSAKTDLTERVDAGTTVPQTSTKLSLTLSKDLVDHLYNSAMKVRKVKGSSRSDVVLQAVGPGGTLIEERSEKVSGLVVPNWVNLTPGSEVTIDANGTVAEVAVPASDQNKGLIYVQMPKSFFLDSEMDPPVLGSIKEAELKCTRQSDDASARVIGTIDIGDGCSESECPLPKATGGNPGGGDDDDDGSGPATDPEVIDPVIPDDETDISDSGYTWEDTDGDGVADTQVRSTSAETTSLPATGSPFAAGLAGLFGALVAIRLALAVRARRTGA